MALPGYTTPTGAGWAAPQVRVMPITKAEFHTAVEQEVEELMDSIHRFLAAQKDTAYSERELSEKLSLGNDRGIQFAFKEALRSLEGLGAIRWGIVKGTDYYIYHEELPAPSPGR